MILKILSLIQKNIKILEKELEKVTKKESLNSISLSGKYIPDAAPYYDPSAAEKSTKAADISQKIADMIYELTKEKGPVFTEENFKVKTKIQNYANLNREATNEFIKKSYYYEPKAKEGPNRKLTVFNAGEKANANEHKLVEADVKDTSASKDVTPHIVSNLKKSETDRKIAPEIKVEKVKKIVNSKVGVVAPKKEVVAPKKEEVAPKKEVDTKKGKDENKSIIDFSGLVKVTDEKLP